MPHDVRPETHGEAGHGPLTPRGHGRALLAIGVLATVGITLYTTGALERISDPDAIRTIVHDAGLWGPLVFFAIALALFPVMLFAPAVWASMLLWDWPLALLYCYTAAVVPSVATFAAVRGGASGRAHVPERLQRYAAALLARPTTTVFFMRVVLWANPAADLLIATSGVGWRPYLIGTLVGMLPPTIPHLFIGAGLKHLGAVPIGALVGVGAVAVLVVLLWLAHRGRSHTGSP